MLIEPLGCLRWSRCFGLSYDPWKLTIATTKEIDGRNADLTKCVARDWWTCVVARQLQQMIAMGSLNLQRQYLFSWLNSHFRKGRTSQENISWEHSSVQRNILASGDIVINFPSFTLSIFPEINNNNNASECYVLHLLKWVFLALYLHSRCAEQ